MTSTLVLSAGLSSPSSTRVLADLLSGTAADELRRRGHDVEVSTIELRTLAHELTDTLLAGFPDEGVEALTAQLRAADAVVVATPIFNTSASALLKLLIDAVDMDVWRDKPVLLGASAGTTRHSLALEYAIRPMFAYLRARIVPTAVFAASSDYAVSAGSEADGAPLAQRARRAADELASLLAPSSDAGGTSRTGDDGVDAQNDQRSCRKTATASSDARAASRPR